MRHLLLAGAALACLASMFLMRIVLHGYTGHGHLDVFHLVVALGAGGIGVALALRGFAGVRPGRGSSSPGGRPRSPSVRS